jgi:hypothetical protein
MRRYPNLATHRDGSLREVFRYAVPGIAFGKNLAQVVINDLGITNFEG